MAAHQAALSLGFSRQEHCMRVPFSPRQDSDFKMNTQGNIYIPKKFENLCGCDWVQILVFPFLAPKLCGVLFFFFPCGFARSKDNNPNYLSFKVEGAAAYYCYYFKLNNKTTCYS